VRPLLFHESNEIELFSSLGGAIAAAAAITHQFKEIQFHFHHSQLHSSIEN